jgi:hypothetical protein
MDDEARPPDQECRLSVHLELCMDRRPISGRLRTDYGADEWFVGWLGFVEALKALHEIEEARRLTKGDAP